MDHGQSGAGQHDGVIYLATSFGGLVLSFITPIRMNELLQGFSYCMSIFAAFMAIRHYYIQKPLLKHKHKRK